MTRITFASLAAPLILGAVSQRVPAQVSPPPEPVAKESTAPAPGPAREGEKAAVPVREPFIAPKNEADFIKSAIRSGGTAAKLAGMALTKSTEEKVKGFAQTVLDEQSAAEKALKREAEKGAIEADAANPKDKEKLEKLNGKSGKEFDEAFLEEMAACHANDLALFEAGKKVASAPGVVTFIEKTLPVIQRRAEKINLMGAGAHRLERQTPAPKPADAAPPPATKPVSA
ncbi:MAG TPA: DUF4142 domain-containing protein [Verrucomicrobiales bacterium]|nr:DUF4142 domain-containing protein [Verrucomicrobiales bacterium]